MLETLALAMVAVSVIYAITMLITCVMDFVEPSSRVTYLGWISISNPWKEWRVARTKRQVYNAFLKTYGGRLEPEERQYLDGLARRSWTGLAAFEYRVERMRETVDQRTPVFAEEELEF